MRIGTAVPNPEELAQVPHHFIQNRSIQDKYSVGQFEKDALNLLNKIYKKTNLVVMVGGSGLYVDAVLKGLDYFPEIDPNIRTTLNKRFEKQGLKPLQMELKKLDFETYQIIDLQNPHRVIRALEVCLGTKKKYSYYKNKSKSPRNFTPIKIGIDAEREIIYNRIDQRVAIMIDEGLLGEAEALYAFRDLNALQTVGYRELFAYFDGDFSLDVAISEIKKNTRRFAKRQKTWFHKDKEIHWFDYNTNTEEIINVIKEIIEK